MDWKKTVGTVAPTIATALGGPLFGMAASAICGIFGIESDGKTDAQLEAELKTAVARMTPAQAIELKKVEQQFIIDMRELDIEVLDLDHKEKDSARKMYGQRGLENKIPQILLGTLIVVGAFSVFYIVLAGKVPDTADAVLVGTIIGAAISELKNLTGFYFGSSASEVDRKNREA